MQLTPNFSLREFVRSDTAMVRGIDNSLPLNLMDAARETAHMMEGIRAYLSQLAGKDVPITITSGYRCQALNIAVGSRDTSDHIRAAAVDWQAPSFGSPHDICVALVRQVDKLGIGQLIHECQGIRRWVHTSRITPAKAVNRILTLNGGDTRPGIWSI